MIVAENLSKTYSGHQAIADVSFKIDEGEIVGLLGLNGAGKSTILKILGCFLLPSSGRARVGGFSVDKDPQEIRRLIGYLPDHPPLYDEMTVESYIHYVAKLKDVPAGEIDGRVAAVLDATHTSRVRGTRLGELSHGYRQRVGIAQALVHGPKVLILDEPINGLDPVQIVEMRDLIRSLKGRHTVILSSHILSEITKTCDRILIVDHGQLVAEGSEAELAKTLVQTSRIACDVERLPPDLIETLKGIPGVTQVQRSAGGTDAGERLMIEASSDVRTKIAEKVVASGAGLCGLSRTEAGLEGLFMKLIKPVEER